MNTVPLKNNRWLAAIRRDFKGYAARILVWAMVCIFTGAVIVALPYLPNRLAPLLALALAGGYALFVIGNLRKVLLAAILIDLPLRWDIYLGARVANAPLGMREGWMIAITTFALLGLYTLHIVQELSKPHSQPTLNFSENLPLLLYMGFVGLSLLAAADTRGALFQVFFLAQMFALYVYIASTVKTTSDLGFILFFLLAGVLVEGLIVLAQRFVGLNINMMGILTVNSYGRMAGTLGSPNVAAGYFSLLLAPAFSLLFARVNHLSRMAALFTFVIGLAGLFFTISRGGWLAFAISMLIFGLMAWLKGRLPTWAVVSILFLAAVGLALFGGKAFDLLTGMRTNAAMARIPLMKLAWRMIEDHPFLGVGANNYVYNMRRYLLPELTRGFLYVVHNKYLLVWAETGLGGILSFLGFLGITIWRGWQCWTRDHPLLSPLALGFAAAVVGQMTHMMVEIFDARTQVQALWLAAALVTAMEHMTRGGTHET